MVWELVDETEEVQQQPKPLIKEEPLVQKQEQSFVYPEPEPEPQSYLGSALQKGAQVGAGVLAGAAGVPESIQSLLRSWESRHQPTQEEFEEQIKDKTPEMQKVLMQMYEESGKPIIPLPSTEQVKEVIGKALPEGYLEPRDEFEQVISNISEDFGALLFPMPGTGITKLGVGAGRKLAAAGLGNIVEYLGKSIGLPEWAQKGLKAGTMLATSLKLDKSIQQRAVNIFSKTEEIGKNKDILLRPVKSVLKDFEKDVIHGTTGAARRTLKEGIKDLGIPSKSELKRAAQALQKQYAKNLQELPFKKAMDMVERNQKVNLRQVVRFKKTLNDVYPKIPGSNGAELTKVNRKINNLLKRSKYVPKGFGEMLETADELWTGVEQSKKANKFIWDSIKGIKNLSPLALLLNPVRTLQILGAAAAGATAGLPSAATYAILKNFSTNKSLQNEYLKMASAAVKENAAALIKPAQKISDIISPILSGSGVNIDPKVKWELVD